MDRRDEVSRGSRGVPRRPPAVRRARPVGADERGRGGQRQPHYRTGRGDPRRLHRAEPRECAGRPDRPGGPVEPRRPGHRAGGGTPRPGRALRLLGHARPSARSGRGRSRRRGHRRLDPRRGRCLPAFASPRGARFLAAEVSSAHRSGRRAPELQPGRGADRPAPLLVEPTRPVGEVARLMTEHGRRRVRRGPALGDGRASGWSPTPCCASRSWSRAGRRPPGRAGDRPGPPRPPVLGDSAAEALITMLDREAEFLLVTRPGRRAARGRRARGTSRCPRPPPGVSLHEQLRRATTIERAGRAGPADAGRAGRPARPGSGVGRR